MDDAEIAQRIGELTDEEHRLELSHADDGLNADQQARLRAIEISLDQCWDLLRQRRARRHSGQDPDDTTLRSADVVEGYEQ